MVRQGAAVRGLRSARPGLNPLRHGLSLFDDSQRKCRVGWHGQRRSECGLPWHGTRRGKRGPPDTTSAIGIFVLYADNVIMPFMGSYSTDPQSGPPYAFGKLLRQQRDLTQLTRVVLAHRVQMDPSYLYRIEAALSSQKISPRGQYTKFNVAALLRGNSRDRFLSYAIARQWGWMSVNDIRTLEDLSPIDGGDVYLQPLNMVDAEAALKILLQDQNTGGAG